MEYDVVNIVTLVVHLDVKIVFLKERPQGGGPHDIVRERCNSKARNESMSPSKNFVWTLLGS
jgi:hypothetical protein